MNSKSFNPEVISMAIEEILNKSTKGLDSELLAWIKQKFESNMHHLIGENLGNITMEIVVDSSSVNNQLNHFAEGKSALLFHLIKNPIFPLCAPPLLEKEVLDYIENKAKKKYDKKKLRDGWAILKSGITIKEIQNNEAIATATKIMKRDPNDIPFVSLIIDTGASAILSQDNDFTDSVRRFTVKTLGEMVGVYHRGLFSFFIMSDLIPPVLEVAKDLIVGVVKILLEFVVLIATFDKAIIKGSVNVLSDIASKLPNWVSGVLITVSLIMMILIAIDEKTRKKVISGLKSLWSKTKPTIDKITSWLVKCIDLLLNYLKKVSPYIGMSASVISDLQKQIELLKKEIKNMKLEDAVNYS
jgi:predicted nucleic acid-binding protein